ncbi:MAG: hypothetical protein AAF226_17235 [Verrucomicrobiota bacterium]
MERPPIEAIGRVVEIEKPDYVYRVEMENGFVAYAVRSKDGPACESDSPIDEKVHVRFSAYDMSRCKIIEWL